MAKVRRLNKAIFHPGRIDALTSSTRLEISRGPFETVLAIFVINLMFTTSDFVQSDNLCCLQLRVLILVDWYGNVQFSTSLIENVINQRLAVDLPVSCGVYLSLCGRIRSVQSTRNLR